MDILELLNGQTVAINPISIVMVVLIAWIVSTLFKTRNEVKEAMAEIKERIAVIGTRQDGFLANFDEMKADQKSLRKMLQSYHNQNIRILFRNGAVPMVDQNTMDDINRELKESQESGSD
jgi:hypothetical protein